VKLPTEQELGDRYKVSRNTVRLALGLLTNEGIITSTPGRGTFVRDRIMLTYHASRAEAADRPDDWHTDAYFTEVREQGRQPSQRFDMRIDPASLGVAQRLRVEEGEGVVVRRMIRYVDGDPWSIQDSSYPMDIAQEAGLLVPHDLPGGTVRAMAEHGHVEVGDRDNSPRACPPPMRSGPWTWGPACPSWPMCGAATPRTAPCASPRPFSLGIVTAWSMSWATWRPFTSVTSDAYHPGNPRRPRHPGGLP